MISFDVRGNKNLISRIWVGNVGENPFVHIDSNEKSIDVCLQYSETNNLILCLTELTESEDLLGNSCYIEIISDDPTNSTGSMEIFFASKTRYQIRFVLLNAKQNEKIVWKNVS